MLSMTLGPTELFILLFIWLPFIVVGIVAIVDAAQQPAGAWAAIGRSQGAWIVLIAVTTFLCGLVGLVFSVVYLASIKPKLQNAAR